MLDNNKTKFEVSADERVSQAQFFLESEHIRSVLSDLDDKYTRALKYSVEPGSELAKEYTYRLRGIQEFVSLVCRPVTIEND